MMHLTFDKIKLLRFYKQIEQAYTIVHYYYLFSSNYYPIPYHFQKGKQKNKETKRNKDKQNMEVLLWF